MARFTKQFRNQLPNKIASHFDKYIQYLNPVEFCALEDVYRQAFTTQEWDALNTLLARNIGKRCLNRYRSFDLKHRKANVCFTFPDNKPRPNLTIDFTDLNEDAQKKIGQWLKSVSAYQALRRVLFRRVKALLDWGWGPNQWDDYSGRWRGGPTSGQGCNTVGQVQRIWPELIVFFPADEIAAVRDASAKSRLPAYIEGYGTPQQFMYKKRPYKHNRYDPDDEEPLQQCDPVSDEEWEFERRKLKAINHILVQMSLMKDVPHVDNYPEVSLS